MKVIHLLLVAICSMHRDPSSDAGSPQHFAASAIVRATSVKQRLASRVHLGQRAATKSRSGLRARLHTHQGVRMLD